MKAIVTGASSGIGLAIARYLLEEGYVVFGIGRDFNDGEKLFQKENFKKIVLDLNDIEESEKIIKEISKKHEIDLLVNNAGIGYYGLHEEISSKKIDELVRINLTIPMIISSLLLRKMKKRGGTIINISSFCAHEINTHGCAYGASKAGLSSFGKSLFFEARKYGIKVVNIEPEMTKTNLYRNANFTASDEENASLLVEDIVSAVAYILSQKENVAINTISLTPQIKRIKNVDKAK